VAVVRLEKRLVKQIYKALRVLYEHVEEGRDYWWMDLVELLRKHGVKHAFNIEETFRFWGILRCDSRGFCKVDKAKLEELLARYKNILDNWPTKSKHRRGGGSGGQAPSQG